MSELQSLLRDLIVGILKEEGLGTILQEKQKAQPASASRGNVSSNLEQKEMIIKRGLLSERMVKSYAGNGFGILKVAKGVVVTPLARDALRYMDVTLKHMGRR